MKEKLEINLPLDYNGGMKKNPHAVALGSIKTAKKAASSRLNGKLYGGRPKKEKHNENHTPDPGKSSTR